MTYREWLIGMSICGLSANEKFANLSAEQLSQYAIIQANIIVRKLEAENETLKYHLADVKVDSVTNKNWENTLKGD